MLNKLIDWIIDKAFLRLNKKSDYLVHFVIVVIIVVPVVLIGAYSIGREYEDMTDLAHTRKEMVVGLTSQAVKERLDHMVDIGKSIAVRPLVRSYLKDGNAKQLSVVIDDITKEFSFIDRIFITDIFGVSLVIMPDSPENIGKDFSFRDWYKGATKNWQPYVSGVYRRTSLPQYNVVTVAIPIKDDTGEEIGVLGLQVKLDIFNEWAKKIGSEFDCVIYFVDKNGKVIGHTQYLSQDDIIDFSAKPAVQNVLKGKDGTEEYFDSQASEEVLVGYKSIPEYNVGILVERSAKKSFALRSKHLIEASIFYSIIFIINSLVAYLIFKIIHVLNDYRRKEKIFLGSIGDGVMAIDRNWTIVLWNKAMSEISGYSEQEAVGKPFREIIKLIRKNDRKEDVAFIEEVLLYGKPMQMDDNMILITKDKKEVPVGDTAAPIFYNDNISGVIIIVRNATKENEAQMIKSDFAYASHQLRTPVSRALWNLESAIHEKSIKKIREGALVAYKSLQSVQKLANELIDVSAIDQGMIVLQNKPMRITDVFEELEKSLELKLKEKGIELAMPLVSASASIETDQKLLSKAIYEIVENAVLYSPEKSKINIELTIQAEDIMIIVSDNGVGIPEEQQALIFTKFFRGRNIDSINIIGVGLGLYIAQQYINLLGGRIWFESGENKGTKVFVLLPIK